MSVFDSNHPERLPDEVFIGNADDSKHPDDSSFQFIGWKTKRKGEIAYNTEGKPILGKFPVFAKIEEIKAKKDGEELLKRMLPQ